MCAANPCARSVSWHVRSESTYKIRMLASARQSPATGSRVQFASNRENRFGNAGHKPLAQNEYGG
jgi:hypothetical protein